MWDSSQLLGSGPALPAQVCIYDLLAFARAAFSPSGPGPETQAHFLNENLAHTVCKESSVPLGKTGEKPGDLDCSRKCRLRGEGQVWRQRSRDFCGALLPRLSRTRDRSSHQSTVWRGRWTRGANLGLGHPQSEGALALHPPGLP